MRNIFSIICYLIIVLGLIMDYIKNKRMYTLLVIVDLSIFIFFKTPFAKGINRIAQNILLTTALMLAFVILYLIFKERKEIRKKSESQHSETIKNE